MSLRRYECIMLNFDHYFSESFDVSKDENHNISLRKFDQCHEKVF